MTSCSPGRPIPSCSQVGQDGGLVSAILVWALEHDVIDAALVSALEDGSTWNAIPAVVNDRAGVLATAGSRYTYSANTLAYPEAVESGAERIALVGMSCQASVPAVMSARKAGKVARRLSLSIGLLCSKTFDDAIFAELFEARYGLARDDIAKINIKGVFQIWLNDGSYHEVPLKEGHHWTREGCKSCPGLRRRARRHRDGWDRRFQRLDAHDHPHGTRPRGNRRHARRRCDRDPTRRRRPGSTRAPAQARPCQQEKVARDRSGRRHGGCPRSA